MTRHAAAEKWRPRHPADARRNCHWSHLSLTTSFASALVAVRLLVWLAAVSTASASPLGNAARPARLNQAILREQPASRAEQGEHLALELGDIAFRRWYPYRYGADQRVVMGRNTAAALRYAALMAVSR